MENMQKETKPRTQRAPTASTGVRKNGAKAAARQALPKTAAEERPRRAYHPRRRRAGEADAGTPAVPVRIMPLGGLGEVGKNITLYECQGYMLLFDFCIVFPD